MLIAMFRITTPQSKTEFERYFDLRWRILRAPWQQSRGSERDHYDDNAVHAMALSDEGHIVGVARLHQINQTTAQIRYMAVEDHWQGSGIGDALLSYLEEKARTLGVQLIKLNARESCVGFYTKRGYRITGPGHLLYGEIKHQKLEKRLDN
jgi:GNAT superfamily N-acetyltransferase